MKYFYGVFLTVSMIFNYSQRFDIISLKEKAHLQEIDNAYLKKVVDLDDQDYGHAMADLVKKQEKLSKCEEAKELMINGEAFAWTQRDHAVAQVRALASRLLSTTEILESEMRCSFYGMKVENCLKGLDTKALMEENYKAIHEVENGKR